MKNVEMALRANAQVADYKINIRKKESFELFFVKGKLETVRCTDTCDKEVTVYVPHEDFLGDAQFLIYPSTTQEELPKLIAEAAAKAMLINNKPYILPEQETGSFQVESNFCEYSMPELASLVAKTVTVSNQIENGSFNALEVFINKHTEQVINSRGLDKTQVRYTAMAEAIPTYNGQQQSVELYEQYNFGSLDCDALSCEMGEMMEAVKARYEAVKPDFAMDCPVVFHTAEINQLVRDIVRNLNYGSVYSHASVFAKGDNVQAAPTGDALTITMAGQAEGCLGSSRFDDDGMTLGSITVVENGKAVNYYGSNRFGQYLGEIPTGNLSCVCVSPGSMEAEDFVNSPYLEIISMSGLQVDFFSDYIGGEVRLAYYYNGEKKIPVTGISVSGQVSQVLQNIRLSKAVVSRDSYHGPSRAIVSGMKIY